MKRPSVEQQVYECMIPRPKSSDPYNFNGILTRYLVFEVRQEVHSFYGHLDTQEAKYPGLDYSSASHRLRLSRWPWHRRLFRAFDTLGLTAAEIASLTKWEGTRWAKERYEKEQQTTIHDSAADDMPDYRLPGSRWNDKDAATPVNATGLSPVLHPLRDNKDEQRLGYDEPHYQPQVAMRVPPADGDRRWAAMPRMNIDLDENMDDVYHGHAGGGGDEESDDGLIQSVGVPLNERLRERVAARNAGDTSLPLDEDWEQWLKNAMEAENWSVVAEQINRLAAQPPWQQQPTPQQPLIYLPTSPGAGAQPAGAARDVLSAARAGDWSNVPEVIQGMLRQTFDAERSGTGSAPTQFPASSTAPTADNDRRQREPMSGSLPHYSGLRLSDR